MNNDIYSLDSEAVVDAEAAPLNDDVVEAMPEWLTANGDGSYTMRLKWPFEVQVRKDGKVAPLQFDSLRVRRTCAADLVEVQKAEKAQKTDAEIALMLLSRLSAKATEIVSRIDADDLARFGEVVERFFPKQLKTGEKSSE